MQAAILAAGKSTRTYPLTVKRPKPLLKAANKTLLEHNLNSLDGIVDEVIIIVGYKKEMIRKVFGNRYKSLKIRYVEQKRQLGTGHAASLLEPFIKDRFILMMGDDIYSRKDIKRCLRHKYSILTARAKNPQNFGVVIEKNGMLVDFVEKPKKFVSGTISTAMFSLDRKIFYYLKKIKMSKRNEIELPDAVKLLASEQKIHCVKAMQWLPIGFPGDLLKADRALRKNGNVIGKNSKIYGKISNSSVGNNCTVKGKVIDSIIMDNATIDTDSIVEDSIIASGVYFKGRASNATIADNVRATNIIAENCRIWPGKAISNSKISNDLK